MILEYPTLEKAASAECVLHLANVPQYTTHPVCSRPLPSSVRTPGEVGSEIGILIACAILLDEIKAGALIEFALMVNGDEPLNKERTFANHFQRGLERGGSRNGALFDCCVADGRKKRISPAVHFRNELRQHGVVAVQSGQPSVGCNECVGQQTTVAATAASGMESVKNCIEVKV